MGNVPFILLVTELALEMSVICETFNRKHTYKDMVFQLSQKIRTKWNHGHVTQDVPDKITENIYTLSKCTLFTFMSMAKMD